MSAKRLSTILAILLAISVVVFFTFRVDTTNHGNTSYVSKDRAESSDLEPSLQKNNPVSLNKTDSFSQSKDVGKTFGLPIVEVERPIPPKEQPEFQRYE